MPIDEDNLEIIEEFVAESTDNIGEVEAILIEMESGTCEADEETLNLIFRAFHSVKGTAGFLELENVVHVTHLAESLLDMLRRGEMTLQPSHVTVFLRGLDCVNRALEEVATEGTDTCIAELAQTVGADLQLEMDAKGSVEAAPDAPEVAAIPELSATTADSEDEVWAEIAALAAMDMHAPLPAAPAMDEEPAREEASTSEDFVSTPQEDDDDLLDEFVTDSLELLDAVDASLAAARDGKISDEIVADGMRGLHTIKGNCGFLGFFELGDLCHSTETGLGKLVGGNRTNQDAVFAAVDALRAGVKGLLEGGKGMVPELGKLRAALESGEDRGSIDTNKLESSVDLPSEDAEPIPRTVDESRKPEPSAGARSSGKSGSKSEDGKPAPKQSIRVDTTKLDELMNLVGELIIAENMVTQNEDLEGHEFESFHKAALHLNRITRSLQDLTMSVRMVPIRPTFRKMLRVARDVARKQEKDIELTLGGEETEVDRSVVEAIGDPLVHLLRNAVDHGVEDVETRKRLGKPAKGQLSLSAHHEAGEVWVVLSDDGKGLSRDRIAAKAIEKGVIDTSEGMTDS